MLAAGTGNSAPGDASGTAVDYAVASDSIAGNDVDCSDFVGVDLNGIDLRRRWNRMDLVFPFPRLNEA